MMPELRKADRVRRKILLNNTILAAVVIIGFVIETMTWMLLAMLAIILFIFWFTHHYRIPFQYLELLHEKIIISKTSAFIFSGFYYDRDKYIKLKDLQNGWIITGTPGQFNGKNLVAADMGNMRVQISEIYSSANPKSYAYRDNTTYFNGLAGIAQFAMKNQNDVIITSENNYDSAMQSLTQEKILIKKDTSSLLVYSSKQTEHNISPAVLLHIKNYVDQTNNNVFISIRDSGVYAAISKNRDSIITTNVFADLTQNGSALEYFTDVKFLVELFAYIERCALTTAS